MALSIDQITQNMLNQLRASDPAFSGEIGTPERKIMEAAAEVISACQVDFSVLDSQNDLDSMSGGRLDAFGNLFGFSRQQGTPATGTVTFSTTNAASADIVIPAGQQVQAPATDPTFPNVVFTITQTVTLAQGTFSVDAPAQAAIPGTIGNIPANAITSFANLKSIVGITGVTNPAAMTGGTDGEDDTSFRTRLKNSLFRNQAGTESNFLALALTGENVTKAVVLGPVSRYQEYVQVPYTDDTTQRTDTGNDKNYDPNPVNYSHKRTTQPSGIPYSKYTYDTGYFLTSGGSNADATNPNIYFRPFTDYMFNRKAIDPTSSPRNQLASAVTAHTPNVTILNGQSSVNVGGDSRLAEGTVLLLEHQYISKHSRNDIPSGIMNAVDVFTDGSKVRTAKSQEVFPPAGNNLQTTNPVAWTYQNRSAVPAVINFRRILDGTKANEVNGNRILPMFWQPCLDVPDSIRIKHSNGTTYTMYKARYVSGGEYYYDSGLTRKANYHAVQEVNGYQGTIRARNGFEFRAKFNSGSTCLAYADGDPAGTPSGPAVLDSGFVGSQFSCTYSYDANVSELQAIMEQNKQVTTDVLVHRAKDRYFKLYLTIMYTPGASQTVVNTAINTAIATFFDSQYFGATIQLSDLLQIVHNIPGVDNVRWSADVMPSGSKVWQASHTYAVGDLVRPTVDNGHIYKVTVGGTLGAVSEPTWPTTPASTVTANGLTYQETASRHRIEEVNPDGSTLDGGAAYYDYDFILQDNELPASPSTNQSELRVRAQNTWLLNQ